MDTMSRFTEQTKTLVANLNGVKSVYSMSGIGCASIECDTQASALSARTLLDHRGYLVGPIAHLPSSNNWSFGAMPNHA